MAEPEERAFLDDHLIAHAQDCWTAECENAARLTDRVRLMLTAIVALVGLGVFKIEWHRAPDTVPALTGSTATVAQTCLTLAVCLFISSAAALLQWRGTKRSIHASRTLALSKEFLENLPDDAQSRRREIFVRKYRAFLDLEARNLERSRKIQRAQFLMNLGLFLVCVTIIVYIWMGSPFVTTAAQ